MKPKFKFKDLYLPAMTVLCLLPLFLLAFEQPAYAPADQDNAESQKETPHRVISLAPSITEIIFLIGAQDKLVGVTRYCDYPPSANKIAKVGGFLDPSYESIVRLAPDLVLTLEEHRDHRKALDDLGIKTFTVSHRFLGDVMNSVISIGKVLGREDSAEHAASALKERLAKVLAAKHHSIPPRVLISVGGHLGVIGFNHASIASRKTIYNEIIEMVGGTNAMTSDIPFPTVSAEGILTLDPDIIIDLVPEANAHPELKSEVERVWKTIPGLRAVNNGHLYILSEEALVRPGPRVVDAVEVISGIVNLGREGE